MAAVDVSTAPCELEAGDRHGAARRRRLRTVCFAGGVAPVLHALIRGLASDWVAASDNAMIAVRSLDVLSTRHHPLFGTASSVSGTAQGQLRHPGPILLDLLSVPVRALGADLGVPLTMAALNIAFVAAVVWLAGVCAGVRAQVVLAIAANAVAWTMGWSRLLDPYNPHATMMAFLLLLVACWALALDRRVGLIAAAVAASFCVQVHVGYVYIVPFTVALAVAARWWNLRSRRVPRAQWTRRDLVIPAAVTVVLWLQPIIDVLGNGRESNPLRLLTASGRDTEKLGLSIAGRIVASLVVVPPAWGRSSFSRLGVIHADVDDVVAAVALTIGVVVLAFGAWRTRADVALSTLAALCASVLTAAVVAVALIPLLELFAYAPHEFRWLWVTGVVVSAVTAWCVYTAAARPLGHVISCRARDGAAVVCIAAVVLVNVANVGAIDEPGLQPPRPAELRSLLDHVPLDDLRSCRGIGVVITMAFPALEFAAVVLLLRENDVDFTFVDAAHGAEFERPLRGDEQCILTIADEEVGGEPVDTTGRIASGAGVVLTLTRTAPWIGLPSGTAEEGRR